VLESLSQSVFLEYLFFVDAGYLPLAEVNAPVAIQVRTREGLIHLLLQVALFQVAIDLAETIKKFFFSYFSIAVTVEGLETGS
jgi:hypothetical protein